MAGRELNEIQRHQKIGLKRNKGQDGLWGEGERWAIEYPYSAAIDFDTKTAWRSIDGQTISRSPIIQIISSQAMILMLLFCDL